MKNIKVVTAPTHDFSSAEKFEAMPAGAATNTKVFNRDVFSQPSSNMSFEDELNFKVGNGFFRKFWVSSPASTKVSDGLGPTFNARACQNCHFKDGRGRPQLNGKSDSSIFLRLALKGAPMSAKMANVPHPIYGSQLQDHAIAGVPAEGEMRIAYHYENITLSDGEVVELRTPSYSVGAPSFGDIEENVALSPRLAPQMIGLGLVEAISTEDLLANEDPNDRDNDGISGKANKVWSNVMQSMAIGRFGHKAGNATIKDQAAGAFLGDMGLSTSIFPVSSGECTATQAACMQAPNGEDEEGVEVSDVVLDLVAFYSKNLAVPARRNHSDVMVLKGKEIFYQSNCAACHIPKFVTQRYSDKRPQSYQLIWPYSDFLLHDMGDGLADGVAEFRAHGGEWRTSPLWGIGHTKLVSGEVSLLHDGRARTVLEAILWHGGEAQSSRQKVLELSKDERQALITFVESL